MRVALEQRVRWLSNLNPQTFSLRTPALMPAVVCVLGIEMTAGGSAGGGRGKVWGLRDEAIGWNPLYFRHENG